MRIKVIYIIILALYNQGVKMKFTLNAQHISNQATTLVSFHNDFCKFFQTRTRSMASTAFVYLKGLLTVDTEKTMAEMERKVESANKQQLAHFISNSPWDTEPLIQQIQKRVVATLNPKGNQSAALIIDESSMKKNGHASVVVKRQYCGSLGKIESCLVGVFLAYATSKETALIGRNLYLPEDWCNDNERCDDADIPLARRSFKTKAQLALELVEEAVNNRIPFDFVHMDAHYGEQPWMLEALEDKQLIFMADIAKDTRVFLGPPIASVESLEEDRFKMSITGEGSVSVGSLVTEGKLTFQKCIVRDTQRGKLVINLAAVRVRRSKNNIPIPGEYWLLVRQELDGSDIKFSLSNAPITTPIDILAEWQSRRYWVERALQDAKGLAGLDQYRITGWRGWHHHTAMVMLAVLYLLTTRTALTEFASKFTLKDALEMVKVLVPQRQPTPEEFVEILREKHENRERSRLTRLQQQADLLAEFEEV